LRITSKESSCCHGFLRRIRQNIPGVDGKGDLDLRKGEFW
jgi:hypothetical protein